MIHDLKVALAGWYLSLANDFISRNEDKDLAWDQPELANIMTRNNITKEDIYSVIPEVWAE